VMRTSKVKDMATMLPDDKQKYRTITPFTKTS